MSFKKFDYNDKKFVGVSNSTDGEVDSTTVFHYLESNGTLKGTYSGGQIVAGQLLGKVNQDGTLEFLYHHLNQAGDLKSGTCFSKPEELPDGRIRLHEKWQWLDEKGLTGISVIEEIRP